MADITPETCPNKEEHGKRRPDWCCYVCGWLDLDVPESVKAEWRARHVHG